MKNDQNKKKNSLDWFLFYENRSIPFGFQFFFNQLNYQIIITYQTDYLCQILKKFNINNQIRM